MLAKKFHLTDRPWPWFIVFCALIDNDIRHQSGQNSVDSRGNSMNSLNVGNVL